MSGRTPSHPTKKWSLADPLHHYPAAPPAPGAGAIPPSSSSPLSGLVPRHLSRHVEALGIPADDIAVEFCELANEFARKPHQKVLLVRGGAALLKRVSETFLARHGQRFWSGARAILALDVHDDLIVDGLVEVFRAIAAVEFAREITNKDKKKKAAKVKAEQKAARATGGSGVLGGQAGLEEVEELVEEGDDDDDDDDDDDVEMEGVGGPSGGEAVGRLEEVEESVEW